MKVKQVRIFDAQGHYSEKVIGLLEYDEIAAFEDCTICTIDEEKTNRGENQLWVSNAQGKVRLFSIIDSRLVGIYAEIMKFTGYLTEDVRKGKIHRAGKRVDLIIWTT